MHFLMIFPGRSISSPIAIWGAHHIYWRPIGAMSVYEQDANILYSAGCGQDGSLSLFCRFTHERQPVHHRLWGHRHGLWAAQCILGNPFSVYTPNASIGVHDDGGDQKSILASIWPAYIRRKKAESNIIIDSLWPWSQAITASVFLHYGVYRPPRLRMSPLYMVRPSSSAALTHSSSSAQ